MMDDLSEEEAVHLIGFSFGGMSALKLAASLPNRVKQLDLIAPAAPLNLGDFLDQMAGKPIFEAAMKGRLGAIAGGQAMMVRISIGSVIKAMFATAPQADRALLCDKAMQTMLRDGLRSCLLKHLPQYKDELRAYVQPWAHTLDDIKCPVKIWHGTSDTWAPLGLSQALSEALGPLCEIEQMESLGHYSALKEALPNI